MELLIKFWPIIIAIVFLGAMKIVFEALTKKTSIKPNFSVYEKKLYLFDSNTEFQLYKTLLELFGDKYHIFPQINYSHLIKPKKSTWEEERKYRNKIDRKSADFVLCDKQQVIPQLVIELDGKSHNHKRKQARDKFIDELTRIVDLPILHLKTNNLEKKFIRTEITNKLTTTQQQDSNSN